MWEIIGWVAVGSAALFGVICALWLMADRFGGAYLSAIVRIFDQTAREQLDLLLSGAKETFGGRREIVVLLSAKLPPLTVDELALLQRYSADIYVICESDPMREHESKEKT